MVNLGKGFRGDQVLSCRFFRWAFSLALAHLASTALRAISLLSSGVSLAARILPPFEPPSFPIWSRQSKRRGRVAVRPYLNPATALHPKPRLTENMASPGRCLPFPIAEFHTGQPGDGVQEMSSLRRLFEHSLRRPIPQH